MKKLYLLIMLPLLCVACGTPPPAAPAPPPPMQAYGNLAQVMRAIPFPNSNIIFDAQSNDPEKKMAELKAAAEKGGDPYAATYAGWQGVENAGIALAEFSNLLTVPHMCQNGMPAPIDRDDWKKFAMGLADAGRAAYMAAQSKNQDNIVDVAGTVTEACAACHNVYRDQPEPKQRCTP